MNRRDLLKASAGAAMALAGLGSVRAGEKASSGGNREAAGGGPLEAGRMELAGRTLQQLRQQYRDDLFGDFLSFMDEHIIDHELGGFMCNAERDGTLVNTNKNSWYVGRGTWIYAFLYNELGRGQKHLEVARKAAEFVLGDAPKGNDLWPAEYDRQGRPIAAKGQYIGGRFIPVSKEVYGDLFIAGGLAEYGRAVGQPLYWDMARQILLKCVNVYDRPDYAPTAPRVYLGGQGSPLPGARLLGVWMLLLRLGSEMLAQREDAQVQAIVDRSLEAVFEHHYNPEYDLLNEVLNHDLSRPTNEYRDLAYTGHGIEVLWMVLYEAHRRKDEGLFAKASRLLRRHLEVAWDDVYGGFFRGAKNVEENTWILDKPSWVPEEALIGLLFVIEHTGAAWAKEWFSRTFAYVQDKYPLKKHGYALWDHWPDRKATFVKHYTRVENFHHPRHLMLNLLSIERMIGRQGKVSGVFPQ